MAMIHEDFFEDMSYSEVDIEKETKTQDLTITNLSSCQSRTDSDNGNFRSDEFFVGDCRWFFDVLPSKWDSLDGTLSFRLVPGNKFRASAQAIFSFLDQSGNPFPHSLTIGPRVVDSEEDHFESVVVTKQKLEELQCIINDSITIRCTLTVAIRSYFKNIFCDHIFSPPSGLHTDLGNILKTGENSDVTFEVEGEMIHGHTEVLCARSHVFKTQLSGLIMDPMGRNIMIDDTKAPVFRALLSFIYQDALYEKDLKGCCTSKPDSISWSQLLLEASDRYGVSRLRELCEDNLCMCLDYKNICYMLIFAKKNNCPKLKELCLKLLADSEVFSCVVSGKDFQELIKVCPRILKEIPFQPKEISEKNQDAAGL